MVDMFRLHFLYIYMKLLLVFGVLGEEVVNVFPASLPSPLPLLQKHTYTQSS